MIEVLASIVGVGVAGYALGSWLNHEDSGCNGHHWGEITRIDAEGVSSAQRREAGFKEEYINVPRRAKSSDVSFGKVTLTTMGFQRCQDCGEYRTKEVTVGILTTDEFEKQS